jgi:chitodextrinase
MIIRNGTLSLVVEDTASAIDQATQLAKDMGGYVVSSRTWQEGKKVAGAITIRVPAEFFTDAVRALKAMAVEVVTEDATSQDVTEEFVDLSSRLHNLEATEEQLLKIMESATEVKDVLAVQRELTKVQGQIEQTKGRLQYLERSSATSLIRITLREVGLDIRIVPSTRKTRVGEEIQFSARVAGGFPPYSYQWDLGDGTISTEEAPEHAYSQEGKFDLSLTITDDKGNTATETEKEFITVEPMEARFGTSQTEIKEGEEIRFFSEVFGGFPPYSYEWDLGDGTTSTERNPRHTYSDAGRYTVSLTISDDKGNTASETRKKLITVTAPPAWSAGKQATGALRALSTVGRWLGTGLIWAAVFIPVWGLIIGLIIAGGILRRRLQP